MKYLLYSLQRQCGNQSCTGSQYQLLLDLNNRNSFVFLSLQIDPISCCYTHRCTVWIITLKNHPACPLCLPCPLFYFYLWGTRNQFELQQALRQSGTQAGRQELNRTEQPAIHMDQVDGLSINGLPLESKTLAQAREELLGEIRIPAAIQVSLYVFAACYSSISLPHSSQPETEPSLRWFIHLYYVLSGGHCWPLLLRAIRTGVTYGLGEGIDYCTVDKIKELLLLMEQHFHVTLIIQ